MMVYAHACTKEKGNAMATKANPNVGLWWCRFEPETLLQTFYLYMAIRKVFAPASGNMRVAGGGWLRFCGDRVWP